MENESPDIAVYFLSDDSCVVVSTEGNFLFTKLLMKESGFTPEKLYVRFYSPHPYSYIKESLETCTSIALKSTWSMVSKSPIVVIACGGEAGYAEIGRFDAV